jgi:hypothetical protein
MPLVRRSSGYPRKGIRIAALAVCAVVGSTATRAADVSIVYKNSSDYRLTDNLNGTEKDKTEALVLTSNHSVDLLAKTKTDLWRLTPTLTSTVDLYRGSGFDPQYFPGITAAYTHTGKRYNFSADAFFNYKKASSSDLLLRRILINENGSELNYGASLGYGRTLSARDSMSASLGYSQTSYKNITTLEPNKQFTGNIGWTRQWTELTSTVLGTSVSYTMPDPYFSVRNARTVDEPDRVEISPSLTLNTRLTKRLAAVANIGMTVIDEKDAKASASFVYSVNATYTLNETSLTAGASRKFAIADSGGAKDTYAFNAGATHQVNDLTSIGATTSLTYTPEPGPRPDTLGFTFSPYVTYKPARDWDTTLSYVLAYDEDDEQIWTNSVILKVSYLKTLLK